MDNELGQDWQPGYMQSRENQAIEDNAAAYEPPPAENDAVPSKRVPQDGSESAEPGGGVSLVPESDVTLAEGAAQAAQSLGSEAAKFFTDVPIQTLGALRDLGEEVNQITAAGGQWLSDVTGIPNPSLEELVPMGGLRLTGDGPFYIPPDEFKTMQQQGQVAGGGEELFPRVAPGRSAVAPFYRNVMRFVFGFNVVKKATLGLQAGSRAGKWGLEMARGAATDMLVWGAHEERLADFLDQYEWARGPVTEWLKSDEDDSVLEGKLKQALEGAGVTIGVKLGAEAVKLLVKGVKAIKLARGAAEQMPDAMEEVAKAAERQSRDYLILGDPTGKLTTTTTVDALQPARHAMGQLDEGLAGHPGAATKTTAANLGPVAKSATKQGGKITVPNFAAFKGPDDWSKVLQDMAEANADIAARGKGGVKSQLSQVQAAKDIGLPELFSLEAGRMKPAELYALKDAYGQSAVMLHKTAQLAAESPNPTNLFNFRKMMAIHQSLLERFMAERAEAGRALNILGRVTELTGSSERLLQMRDLLEEMGGEDVAQALAEKIANMQHATPEALNSVVKRGWAAKTMDAVQEAWVLGLVSGPRSQARNILSNAAYAVQLVGERAWAARMPGSTVEKGEALAAAHGMVTSLREAFVNSGKAFWNGTAGYGVGKVDLPYRKAISGEAFGLHGAAAHVADGIGELYRVWGRFLTAGDEFFKTLNYGGEKSALAVRRAVQEGLTGEEYVRRIADLTANPDEALRIASRDAANYATFTTKLGKAGQYWQGMVGELPMLRFLTPFMRTPGNIFKAGLSRSPLALAMPKTFWAEVAKGGAARDMAIAKFTMGSSLMALWSDLTLRGMINGAGPSDQQEFRAWYEAGNRPYTINLPVSPALGSLSGKQIDYRTIEPIGTMLGMAADVTHRLVEYNEIADSGDPDAQERMWKLASASVFALAENLTNTTFMRSASEFFAVVNDPAMYAERWLERYTQTVVPRIVATWKQSQDPTLREVNGPWEAIQSQIPWVSEGLYPVRDFDGHPRTHGTTWGPDWLSPLYVGDPTKAKPHQQAMIEQKMQLNKPRWTQSFQDPETGESVRIDLKNWPGVYDEYRQLEGHKFKHPGFEDMGRDAFLSALVQGTTPLSEIYLGMQDGHEEGVEDKGNFVAGIVNKYRQASREAIMKDPAYAEKFHDFREEISRRARIINTRKMRAVQ